jgi:tetratricopeptide (TPR) repeat protein
MMQRYRRSVILAAILITGCSTALTPDDKAAAHKQWNDARAGVLASLAEDQFKSGNLDKCQETLDRALGLEPESSPLHLLAAKLAIEQGKLELAQSELTLAGKYDPKDAEADYLNGVILQRWRLMDKAHDAYAKASEKNPQELGYLLAEVESLVDLKQPDEAIALLQSKQASFEHSGLLRDEMGQLQLQQGHVPEAIASLQQAVVMSADDAGIREHLAFALLAGKHYGEAADTFRRLIKDDVDHKRADLFAALAECEIQLNQPSLAQADYQSAVAIDPANINYLLDLGRISLQLGDLDAADSAGRKVLQANPASAEAKCLLGYVELKRNQLPESLASFKAAAESDPADSVSLCLEGIVLKRLGRAAEARQMYSRAIELNPHDELAGKLMAGINEDK